MTTPTPHGAPELPVFAWLYEGMGDNPDHIVNSPPETMPATAARAKSVEPLVRLLDARAAIQQAAGAVPENLAELLQSCRGSVKADLMRYEQMILRCRTMEMAEVFNGEANRLRALLDSIDELVGREAGKEGSSDHLVPCAGGGVTQPLTAESFEAMLLDTRVTPAMAARRVVDALDTDAQRYRHLRECRGMEHDPLFAVRDDEGNVIWGGDLDDEIDKSIAYSRDIYGDIPTTSAGAKP